MNKFVVSYAGRHNYIKGYDRLKRIATIIWKEYPDVYFLIMGKEEPLKGLDDYRWIEIGWTEDPHSYINASDVFLLPNIETYFDLILLEVMSLGKMVLMSNSGGNKYFKRYDSEGIKYFDDIDGAVSELCNYMKYDSEKKNRAETNNLKIFETDFTCQKFASRYCEIMNDLGGDVTN